MIFGTLQDSSLKNDSLSWNNCFSYRNVLQTGVNALSQMVLKISVSCQKAQNFVHLELCNFAQTSLACCPNMYQIIYEKLTTSGVSICNGSTEEFWWQIYCKNWFSDREFYVTITEADLGSLKFLHTLFGKYLNHMLVKFEQKFIVRNIHNFKLFGKKRLSIFEKVLTPSWKTFLWHKWLFDAKVLIESLLLFHKLW